MKTDKNNALVVFQDKKIRRIWYNDEWYFSVIDVINALEASSIPKRYWSDLKAKLAEEGFEPYDKIVQLKLPAEDGNIMFKQIKKEDLLNDIALIERIRKGEDDINKGKVVKADTKMSAEDIADLFVRQ